MEGIFLVLLILMSQNDRGRLGGWNHKEEFEMTFRKCGWALVIAGSSLFLAAMPAARRMDRELMRLQRIRTREDLLDETLAASFPASDPASH